MKIYNTIDEKGRFMGFKVDLKGDGQYDSHTYSYLFARDLEKEIYKEERIGLEALVKDRK